MTDKDMALPASQDRATAASQSNPQAVSSIAGIPSAEPRALVFADDHLGPPLLYACPTCRLAYSVASVGLSNAYDMAKNCEHCRPKQYVCDTCGEECPKYWTRCSGCRHDARVKSATEIPDDGGPYFAFGDDRMFWELDEAADEGHEWVCPTTVAYPRISAENVLDNVTEDMFEDASVDDLVGVDELCAAIEAFNTAQSTKTYWADETRKIRVPAQAGEAGTAETGTGSVHEHAVSEGNAP